MKEVKCKDLGMKSCPFVAKGRTIASIKDQFKRHGKKVHDEAIMKMTKVQKAAMDKKISKLAKNDVKK